MLVLLSGMAPAGRPKTFDEQRALSAALGVFWAKGYEGATMAELVHAMGIGRQSLYDTFGDKRALYLKALAAYRESGMTPLLERLAEPTSAMDRLRNVFDAWVAMQTGPACKGCLLTNAAASFGSDDPAVAEVIKDHQRRLVGAFERVIAEGQASGEITTRVPATELAAMLACVGHGLSIAGRSRSNADVVAAAARAALAALEPCPPTTD